MTTLVGLILTLLTFAFITYPFFKQKSPSVDLTEDEKSQELYSNRDITYSMIKELEFDLQAGILSEDDYQELETSYKKKAISILRDIDDLEGGTAVEAAIEKQVLELRQSKGLFCPQCGTKYHEGDRFCSNCGVKQRQGEDID
jgi:uncharacterized protein (DUF2225 family)